MEKLLHYIWKHRILPYNTLQAFHQYHVEIINPGFHNSNQGPDFFNAKIKLDDTIWAGNIEIHVKSSDWYLHAHHLDPAYNNTILHIVLEKDREVMTENGRCPLTVQIELPQDLLTHYHELCETMDYPRCYRMMPHVPPMKVHAWMDALLVERIEKRANLLLNLLKQSKGDWEQMAFVALSRSFGFGLNGDALELWAKKIPLLAMAKHRDNLFQVTSAFLGMASLLDRSVALPDWDAEMAKREFAFLAHKFSFPQPVPTALWKYLRTRPSNFPHTRIVQLSQIFSSGKATFRSLLKVNTISDLKACLGSVRLSDNSLRLILVNTIVPLLYAYGIDIDDEAEKDRALALLEHLPAEQNYIVRQWQKCGLQVTSAADSQALLQLKRFYCDNNDCLRCRFGYEYLKR